MALNITLIKGPTGSGKTKKLQEEYQVLLDKGIRSDKILVLVRNRRQSILWRDAIKFKMASSIRIQSFFGFIQGEIKKYWTLINSNMDGFKKGMIEPVFLTTELSQFMMTQYIEYFRKQRKLLDITAVSQKIAIEGLNNLSKSAITGTEFRYIANKLWISSKIKNSYKQRLYKEFEELLNYYFKACKQNGYIDYASTIDIYNKYLINNQFYMEKLTKKIKYLIVDGLEEAVPCETDFINYMLDYVDACTFSFSVDGSISRKQGACPEYVQKIIFPKCSKVVNIEESFTCKKDIFEFSQNICDKLVSNSNELGTKKPLPIDNIRTELRSQMINEICLKINKLLSKGFKAKDIVIICPVVDSVLEYCLKSFFRNKNISITNTSRTRRYLDGSFTKALITLACLCHPQWEINPPEHDISNLIGMILGLDPIRSSLITKEVVSLKPFSLPNLDNLKIRDRIGFNNTDKYMLLKNWIEGYRQKQPLSIDAFFESAFIAVLLKLPKCEENINMCRLLIESASLFIKTIGDIFEKDAGKAFVKMIRQGVKPAETLQDIEQKLYSDHLIIATPQAYISSSTNRRLQLWTDVSSSSWYKSDVEELSNPYVFLPMWKEGDIWTEKLDKQYQMLKCSALVKRLLRKCSGQVILAQSEYNQDGYENEGLLAEIMEELSDAVKT